MNMTNSSAQNPGPLERFTVDALTVSTYPNPAALAQAAAALALEFLKETFEHQEGATVMLATGNSQLQFLEELFGKPSLDWSRVTFFHMDEYLGLPPDDPACFRRYLRENVERRIGGGAFHYINGDAVEPLIECARYSALLRAQPLDLCFSGVGDNGHLAFNDPPVANFDDPYTVKLVNLDEISRRQQVRQGHFASVETMPHYAFTVTIPALLAARRILCLVPGGHKASIIKTMLREPVSSGCPASVLRRHPKADLLLDQEAVAQLH